MLCIHHHGPRWHSAHAAWMADEARKITQSKSFIEGIGSGGTNERSLYHPLLAIAANWGEICCSERVFSIFWCILPLYIRHGIGSMDSRPGNQLIYNTLHTRQSGSRKITTVQDGVAEMSAPNCFVHEKNTHTHIAPCEPPLPDLPYQPLFAERLK